MLDFRPEKIRYSYLCHLPGEIWGPTNAVTCISDRTPTFCDDVAFVLKDGYQELRSSGLKFNFIS